MTYPTSTLTATFRTTPLFDWNYSSKARTKINQGGTSSGKTYAIEQVIFMRLIEEPLIATVVGQDIPNLKKGALRDFQDRILGSNPWMNEYIESYNKSERVYRFKNGSVMEFSSYQDAQDAKSGKRDILFVNEANGVSWPIFEQLEMRTSREVFIDYNPTSEFWAHERVMPRRNAVTFYSNFTHNPFADRNIVEYICSLKDTDLESWRVYGLGKTGSIAELCIENIIVVPEMPKRLKYRGYGLDFGYRAHPTALIECGLQNERDVYLDEKFYLHRMKTRDIDLTMKAMNVGRRRKIIADSAQARVVDDLHTRGYNILPIDKGPDSVKYGLSLLNQYNLHVTERSLNIINEQKKYRHKVDKDGKILDDPIKAFDDAWDAIRYWAMYHLKPLRRIRYTYRAASA